jgi:hypothetical protein
MTQQLSEGAHWRGSDKTKDLVRKQIAERWGEEEAKKYDLTGNLTEGLTVFELKDGNVI